MNTLTVIFLLGCIILGAIIIWTYTKNGKKWLENL